MIRRITGKIVEKNVDNVVIDCGGLGYRVWTNDEIRENTPITLWTYHSIREDSQDLYGFIKKQDLEFFELLLTVSGIGPKTAIGLINSATVETLRKGIYSKDPVYLSKISGMGKKTAEKIVFELSGKLSKISDYKDNPINQDDHDTFEALISLGYDEKNIRKILNDLPQDMSQKDKIKKAISSLSKK
jgi:Holliday junction DNA helicase RuvA